MLDWLHVCSFSSGRFSTHAGNANDAADNRDERKNPANHYTYDCQRSENDLIMP